MSQSPETLEQMAQRHFAELNAWFEAHDMGSVEPILIIRDPDSEQVTVARGLPDQGMMARIFRHLARQYRTRAKHGRHLN